MATFRTLVRGTTALSAAGCLAAILAGSPAQAAVMLQVSFSTNGGGIFSAPVVVNDGGIGDLNTAAGAVLSIASAGGISGNASVTGSPALPLPNISAGFSVNGVPVPNTILRLEFSQTGIPNAQAAQFLNGFSLSGLQNVNTTISSFISPSDTAFGTDVLLASQTFTSTDGFNFINSFTPSSTSTSYAETIRADISFVGGVFGSVGGAMAMTAVSEPMTIALLGAGLLGLALVRRRAA
jgi:hypothetical protein